MSWKKRSLRSLAEMVCGDAPHFLYRKGWELSDFFSDCGLDFVHDGSTRWSWTMDRLCELLAQPSRVPEVLPEAFVCVIRASLDKEDAQEGDPERTEALAAMNTVLRREGWEAFFDARGQAQVRHLGTGALSVAPDPHQAFSPRELRRREDLSLFLAGCSEDDLVAEVLLPLFRYLGFRRVTAAGHKDRALEYGKDMWMKYTLPTQNVLYFGIQVKKGKLDAAASSKNGATNIAEVVNQISMMLAHEVFDPEINRRVLVDHAYIVAGGAITKAARNWIGEKLDAARRSQVMFMDRDDLLNLFAVTELEVPSLAPPAPL